MEHTDGLPSSFRVRISYQDFCRACMCNDGTDDYEGQNNMREAFLESIRGKRRLIDYTHPRELHTTHWKTIKHEAPYFEAWCIDLEEIPVLSAILTVKNRDAIAERLPLFIVDMGELYHLEDWKLVPAAQVVQSG